MPVFKNHVGKFDKRFQFLNGCLFYYSLNSLHVEIIPSKLEKRELTFIKLLLCVNYDAKNLHLQFYIFHSKLFKVVII